MLVRLSPRYRFVCDHCGIEAFAESYGEVPCHKVVFVEDGLTKVKSKKGEVCNECATAFWEIANNFFDEVNKEGREDDE